MRESLATVLVVLLVCLDSARSRAIKRSLSEFIHHYEPVRYDIASLHQQHRRARRSADQPVRLEFSAFDRRFALKLTRDTVFHNDILIEDSFGPVAFDVASAYVGHLEDEPNSNVWGTISKDGRFEGKVTVNTSDAFFIQKAERYFPDGEVDHHSVIYNYKHVDYPLNTACKSDELWQKWKATHVKGDTDDHDHHDHHQHHEQEHLHDHYRMRRAAPTKTVFNLYLQADHLFYQWSGSDTHQVIEQLTQHVQAVNDIYRLIDFNGDGTSDGVEFLIERIKVHTDKTVAGYKFAADNIGVEKFLDMHSEANYDPFCLAFIFTYRDFGGGVLGLAWTGSMTGAGGVCERNGIFHDVSKSLNAGLVTTLNYGKDVPPTVTHVTLAHEMGHNFGSGHDADVDSKCAPGGNPGNFIMYARATSGDQPNNLHFSPCSLSAMGAVVTAHAMGSQGCFQAKQANATVCGNGIVEVGEQCDCGWDDDCTDKCCVPRKTGAPANQSCMLTAGSTCSPSNGPCCDAVKCQIVSANESRICHASDDCNNPSSCDGTTAVCPQHSLKPDGTICNSDMTCIKGFCSGSLCLAFGFEGCQCDGSQNSTLYCHLCCKKPGNTEPCKSSFDIPEVPDKMAKPGSACKNYLGYCDVFSKCREVDPSGSLKMLASFLSAAGLEGMKDWLVKNWWIILVSVLGFIILMIIVVKVCGKKPPKIEDTEEPQPPGPTPPPNPSRGSHKKSKSRTKNLKSRNSTARSRTKAHKQSRSRRGDNAV